MHCEILHPMVWGTSVHLSALIIKTINLFLPCKLIFWKRYQSWYPSKFSKAHISVVGNPQSQYFITLSLDSHWTYFWKHYLYYKKDTKVGIQNFGYQIFFCTRLLKCDTKYTCSLSRKYLWKYCLSFQEYWVLNVSIRLTGMPLT